MSFLTSAIFIIATLIIVFIMIGKLLIAEMLDNTNRVIDVCIMDYDEFNKDGIITCKVISNFPIKTFLIYDALKRFKDFALQNQNIPVRIRFHFAAAGTFFPSIKISVVDIKVV